MNELRLFQGLYTWQNLYHTPYQPKTPISACPQRVDDLYWVSGKVVKVKVVICWSFICSMSPEWELWEEIFFCHKVWFKVKRLAIKSFFKQRWGRDICSRGIIIFVRFLYQRINLQPPPHPHPQHERLAKRLIAYMEALATKLHSNLLAKPWKYTNI